jgi:hypothetical protein
MQLVEFKAVNLQEALKEALRPLREAQAELGFMCDDEMPINCIPILLIQNKIKCSLESYIGCDVDAGFDLDEVRGDLSFSVRDDGVPRTFSVQIREIETEVDKADAADAA